MNDVIRPTGIDELKFSSQIVDLHGHRVLSVSGEIDAYTAPQFMQAVMSILDGDEQHLIIDMHNISYLDSTGFTVLISAVKRVSPKNGTVNLVGCKTHVEHILLVTQLSTFMALHQTLEDALKAVSSLTSP